MHYDSTHIEVTISPWCAYLRVQQNIILNSFNLINISKRFNIKFMKIKIFLVLTTFLSLIASQVQPPVWPEEFQQVFVETFKDSQIHISGKIQYSDTKKMSRVTRLDGKYEQICGSIMPNVTTPCSQLVRDEKRYVIFPQKRFCCLCCDAAHGCGILRRDWLKQAKFEGNETISGQSFYKWSKPDGDVLDYYWTTMDQKRIPRKLDEGGSRIKEFIMNTYSENPIPEQAFHLPSYCTNTCSPSSVCGKFQKPNIQTQ